MKVLMISADPRILTPGTPAAQRMRDYAALFDELHVIVLCRIRSEERKEGNLFLYAACGGTLIMRLWRAWRIASACLAATQCDVISSQGADETGVLGFFLSQRYGLPLQLQIHTDILSPWYRRASWREYARYLLGRFLMPRVSCLRVASERIRRSVIDAGMIRDPSRVAVLPIFTDTRMFAEAGSDPEIEKRCSGAALKIIAVGRFVDREKNFSMLIDAMAGVVGACPTAMLMIVGGGPDRKKYEARIARHRLQKNVILEPWRDDLASVLKSFDIFALSSRYEGWGMAVIEAMASGLAVVMTDVGLAGEVVRDGENGVVVPVGDKDAFLQAIKMLYKDEEKRKQLAAAGRETAKNLQPRSREEYLVRYRESFDPKCGT